jgi:hypothetical protein
MESPSDNTDQSDKSEENQEEVSKGEIDIFYGTMAPARVRNRIFEAATDIGEHCVIADGMIIASYFD